MCLQFLPVAYIINYTLDDCVIQYVLLAHAQPTDQLLRHAQ